LGLQVVVGGQFGSEAKGAVTAAICAHETREGRTVTVVRVGGPNAGHSAADPTGRVWALRQIPAGMVVHPSIQGIIASGSEIDFQVLDNEIEMLADAGIEVEDRLLVSDAATVITPEHRQREIELIGAIGSTGKGIGAARADRIMRRADTVASRLGTERTGAFYTDAHDLEANLNQRARSAGHTVVLEGTQGYGLGLHTRYYPQVTSGNCRAIDVCAQAGINPWGALDRPQIHVVVRPYPIRVAGNSGPLLGETTWEELGQPVERTTVTKKVRRVGTYDPDLVDEAITANSPYARLAVSMVDKVPGAVEDGDLTAAGYDYLQQLAMRHSASISWFGLGPTLADWHRA
jgi:adenylosuccinate synthase